MRADGKITYLRRAAKALWLACVYSVQDLINPGLERCAYCDVPEDQDCLETCPMRACGTCGGLMVVANYDDFTMTEEGKVYYAKPCPACVTEEVRNG